MYAQQLTNKQECHPFREQIGGEIHLAETIILQVNHGGETGRDGEEDDLKMVTGTSTMIFHRTHNMVASKAVFPTMDQVIVVIIKDSMGIHVTLMQLGGLGPEDKATTNNPRPVLRTELNSLILLLQRRRVGK